MALGLFLKGFACVAALVVLVACARHKSESPANPETVLNVNEWAETPKPEPFSDEPERVAVTMPEYARSKVPLLIRVMRGNPDKLMADACSRQVELEFNVDRNGQPTDIVVTSSSGVKELDEFSAATVSEWKYAKYKSDEPDDFREGLTTTIVYREQEGCGEGLK